MIGVALSAVMDIRWVLVIGGVVRLLGALMFSILRIEDAQVAEMPVAA